MEYTAVKSAVSWAVGAKILVPLRRREIRVDFADCWQRQGLAESLELGDSERKTYRSPIKVGIKCASRKCAGTSNRSPEPWWCGFKNLGDIEPADNLLAGKRHIDKHSGACSESGAESSELKGLLASKNGLSEVLAYRNDHGVRCHALVAIARPMPAL